MLKVKGTLTGAELRGGEQAGAGAKERASSEARPATEAGGCLVPEPSRPVED